MNELVTNRCLVLLRRKKDEKTRIHGISRTSKKKALQGEQDGLTWDQLKKKGDIEQTHLCYTWARELQNEIGLIRERRGRNVYWKLKGR
jgi:hypothetical protein